MNRTQWSALADSFESDVCDLVAATKSRRLHDIVTRRAKRRSGQTLVDLGCGIGTFLHRFHRYFDASIGVEFSPAIIKRARARLRGQDIRFVCDDIVRASSRLVAVSDLTSCLNVLTTPNPIGRQRLWQCVADVTAISGFAVVVVPSIESAHFVADATGEPLEFSKPRHGTGVVLRSGKAQKHYARREAVEHLASIGFTNVRSMKMPYSWSLEGGPPDGKKHRKALPWDWMVTGVRSSAA